MPRICRYCHGIATVSPDFNNPRTTPDRHGLAKDRQGFFTDAPGLTIRGNPDSEPGQWDVYPYHSNQKQITAQTYFYPGIPPSLNMIKGRLFYSLLS